jgi:hypothetical protein
VSTHFKSALSTRVERRYRGGSRVNIDQFIAAFPCAGIEHPERFTKLTAGPSADEVFGRDRVREQTQGKKPGKVGRPGIAKDLRELILRIATANAQWGYRRIVGELRKLALSVSSSTVIRMPKDEGIYPEPSKGRSRTGDGSWRRFIRLHMDTLIACDFFTKKITTPWGIRTAYCLFFIHLGSRKVFLTSATYHADDKWVLQNVS